ncbi:MAG: AraC family transcriptional regulator [Planctomycetota bacterium]|jgi:AraC-like DNA-binding protein
MVFADYDPGIRVQLCDCHRLERWGFGDLSAPHWRLYWNDRPGAAVSLRGRRTALTPARFLVIPPDTPFAARLRRPVVHFYMHFTADPPFDSARPGIYAFPAKPALRSQLGELRRLLGRRGGPGPRASLLCRALAAAALSRVPERAFRSGPADGRVLTAVRAMEARLAEPPSNSELADVAGMSTNAFIRLFRRSTGRTPQAYLTSKRIETACLLLAGSARTIEEIAAAAGFCDRYHFSRVFKRLRGTGPADYRRRCVLERAGANP